MGIRGLTSFLRRSGEDGFITDNLASELSDPLATGCTFVVDLSNLAMHLLNEVSTPHEKMFAPALWKLPSRIRAWTRSIRAAAGRPVHMLFVLDGMSDLDVNTDEPRIHQAINTGSLVATEFGLDDAKFFEMWPLYYQLLLQTMREMRANFVSAIFEADDKIVEVVRHFAAKGRKVVVFSSDSDFFLVKGVKFSIVPLHSIEFNSSGIETRLRIIHDGLGSVRRAFAKALRLAPDDALRCLPDERLQCLETMIGDDIPVFLNPARLLELKLDSNTLHRFDAGVISHIEASCIRALTANEAMADQYFKQRERSKLYWSLIFFGQHPRAVFFQNATLASPSLDLLCERIYSKMRSLQAGCLSRVVEEVGSFDASAKECSDVACVEAAKHEEKESRNEAQDDLPAKSLDDPSFLILPSPCLASAKLVRIAALQLVCRDLANKVTPISVFKTLAVRAIAGVYSIPLSRVRGIERDLPDVYNSILSDGEVEALHILLLFNRFAQLLLLEHELYQPIPMQVLVEATIPASLFFFYFRSRRQDEEAIFGDLRPFLNEDTERFLQPLVTGFSSHVEQDDWETQDVILQNMQRSHHANETRTDDLLPQSRETSPATCPRVFATCVGFIPGNRDRGELRAYVMEIMKDLSHPTWIVPGLRFILGSTSLFSATECAIYWRDEVDVFLHQWPSQKICSNPIHQWDVVFARVSKRAWFESVIEFPATLNSPGQIQAKGIPFLTRDLGAAIQQRSKKVARTTFSSPFEDDEDDDHMPTEGSRFKIKRDYFVPFFASAAEGLSSGRRVRFRVGLSWSAPRYRVHAFHVHVVA